jgi:hypothetical protein
LSHSWGAPRSLSHRPCFISSSLPRAAGFVDPTRSPSHDDTEHRLGPTPPIQLWGRQTPSQTPAQPPSPIPTNLDVAPAPCATRRGARLTASAGCRGR